MEYIGFTGSAFAFADVDRNCLLVSPTGKRLSPSEFTVDQLEKFAKLDDSVEPTAAAARAADNV